MELLLEEDLLNNSKSLKQVFNYLEKNDIIKVSSSRNSNGINYVLVTFFNEDDKRDKTTFKQALLENTQLKLLESFFRSEIMTSEEKNIVAFKNLYTNYVSSTYFDQKFGIKDIDKLKFSQEQKLENIGADFLDKFGTYIEKQENKIVKHCDVFQTNTNIKEVFENIKAKYQKKRQIQAKILSEKLKTIHYIEEINGKTNLVMKNFTSLSTFKLNNQLQDESIELFYQEKLLKNLKLHREMIEKRILTDLYSEEQILAISSIKEGIEKKINLLVNNKNYMEQRLRESEKRSEDVNFVDVVSQISDLSKIIQKRESQLKKLQNLSRRFE